MKALRMNFKKAFKKKNLKFLVTIELLMRNATDIILTTDFNLINQVRDSRKTIVDIFDKM
jgi:hypothetical protein